MQDSYTVRLPDFVVCAGGSCDQMLVCDKPRGADKKALEKYFEHGYKLFTTRIEALKNPRTTLSPAKERELRFMFEALVSAKQMLSEK